MGRNFKWAIITKEKAKAYARYDDDSKNEEYVYISFNEEYDLRSCSSEIYGGTYTLKELAHTISELAIKMSEVSLLDDCDDEGEGEGEDYEEIYMDAASEYSDIAGAITAYSIVMKELAQMRDKNYVAIIEYH